MRRRVVHRLALVVTAADHLAASVDNNSTHGHVAHGVRSACLIERKPHQRLVVGRAHANRSASSASRQPAFSHNVLITSAGS